MLFKPSFKKNFLAEINEIQTRILDRNSIVSSNNGLTEESVILSSSIRVQIAHLRIRLQNYTKNPDFQRKGFLLLDKLKDLEKNSVPQIL